MNGYSEASIVCGGNIGDPGFYLYLAKVKQKLQKILKTDREDLLIEKVERWNSVRVTFRLPPTSADILRSVAEQQPEALRNLGIQSVQVDAGRLVTVGVARSTNSSTSVGASAHSSAAGVVWNQPNAGHLTLANATVSSGGNDSLLSALVEASTSSDDEVVIGQRKNSIVGQIPHAQETMAAKGTPQHQPTTSSSVQQQPNLLGYLLEEPDQPVPPAPPPYQDYNQQRHQAGSVMATSASSCVQQQRWQQQHPNTTVLSWNHQTPPTYASANAPVGQVTPEYYYHVQHPQAPHPSVTTPHQHHQYMNPGSSAMHSRQQDTAAAMAYSSGINNSSPAFGNYSHHPLQPNPGNVSNSPLLVGLLQQNSPPPPQPSSTFMQPSTTPLLRNNSGNLSGFGNELTADSSPPTWVPASTSHISLEPVAKRQKRTAGTAKPKKTPNNAKGSTAKKTASKRAGATVTSDGNSSLDSSITASAASFTAVDDQHNDSQPPQSASTTAESSINRDVSISSVIDSVLCNVAMGLANNDGGSATMEVLSESKTRPSLDSPVVQAKSTPPSSGPVPGHADETLSQCCSSPMSAASVSTIVQHRHAIEATGSPIQHLQQRQQQSVLRSVSSSSSSSSPLVASASPTFDAQWHHRSGGVAPGLGGGVPPYGAFQNQSNHQFVRHNLYQHQDMDLGVGRIRRPAMIRQPPPRFAQTSPTAGRFPAYSGLPNASDHPYPPQTTYDLAHHDTSRIENNAYSSIVMQPNVGKARSPAVVSVNGDAYLSPTSAGVPRHPLYHGQQVGHQEQYGASSCWTTGGGNGDMAGKESAGYMISSKTTAAVTLSSYGVSGRADHDYLVASSGGAPFASDQQQQQPPVANDFYGFTSTASQPHHGTNYNYSPATCRAGDGTPIFYNGGGDGQQMQQALVARQSSAYDPQQPHSTTTTHWDKQQQRLARHRQSWALHPAQQSFEQPGAAGSGGVYDEDSMMRDMTGSVGSAPIDGFSSTGQSHQSIISTASPQQQHLHNHSVSIQQQQSSTMDDPMLSGQVPAR